MPTQLPRTIDEPPYLMFWRADDAMMPMLGFALGIIADEVLTLAGIGLVGAYIYQRVRVGRPEMFLLHACYWYGFYPSRGHALIHPYIREIAS